MTDLALLPLLLLSLQAAAQHRAAVKERKKVNQEKSAQVQKVGRHQPASPSYQGARDCLCVLHCFG